jgi:hypothetical protein
VKRNRLAALALGLVLLLSGCGSLGTLYTYRSRGLLYTHTVRPLTRHREPVAVAPAGTATGNMKQIQFRQITIVWDDNAIGEIAKRGGIGTIHYADLETHMYLFNLWTRHTVIVYGTAASPPAESPTDSPALPPDAGAQPGGTP